MLQIGPTRCEPSDLVMSNFFIPLSNERAAPPTTDRAFTVGWCADMALPVNSRLVRTSRGDSQRFWTGDETRTKVLFPPSSPLSCSNDRRTFQ